MNTAPSTLIQLLLSLLSDPAAVQAFQQDPAAFVAQCGLTDLTPDQVHDAAVLVADQAPPAAQDTHWHTPPPPAPHPHDPPHEAAVKYLTTYVTNTWIDDRHTIIDNSVNQKIDTHGGDLTQSIDTHTTVASGDGAVAAGGAITGSTVLTGDHNTLGNGNVTGDGNTTAFGTGNAASTTTGGDLSVGAGGAYSTAGAAAVNNSDNSQHTATLTSADSSVHDSNNNLSDNSVHDSGNSAYAIDSSSHDTATSTTDASLHHVNNVDVHAVAP